MTNSHRVIYNAVALYAKVVITALLALVSSRLVLGALGVVDFGLFSLIAGIMGFLGFLNSAMATSSQRHLAYELGRGDSNQLNRIFNACLFLHVSLAILVVFVGETAGVWFLNHVLNVPEARRDAAFWIYQLTILNTICSIVVVPYQALLTAHEDLGTISALGIVQSFLTFGAAILITHAPGDRLITYMAFSSVAVIVTTVLQIFLCRHRYPESRISANRRLDRRLFGDLIGFSGWNLFGSLSVVGRLQGVAFLLNVFFGPVINAAYGVANQVSGFMAQFTQAIQQAVSPQLLKKEGAGNRQHMLEISLLTSKYSFFLACFCMVPLFTEIQTVLALWLKNPPEHSVVFCRIVLLMFACDQLSAGFSAAVQALGTIARYQMLIGTIHLLTIPLAYLLLKIGYDPNSVLLCSLFTVVIATFTRGLLLQSLTGLPYSTWLATVVVPGLLGIVPTVLGAALIYWILPSSIWRTLLLFLATGTLSIAGAYYFGISASERTRLRALAHSIFRSSNTAIQSGTPVF